MLTDELERLITKIVGFYNYNADDILEIREAAQKDLHGVVKALRMQADDVNVQRFLKSCGQ